MSSTAITIRDLSKSFGDVQALDGFSMTVDKGEVAAFLGPNGAGKSTAIRVLLGLLKADSGEVRVLDRDPWRDAVDLHRHLVYVPGDVSLWPQLTGGEAIDVLHRLRDEIDVPRRDTLIERFELDPTKKCRTYSKGNRQKVALVAALSSDVDLYILDEPTSGLDPLMEAVFTECVSDLRAQGRTVLLSSHILAEVEKLGDTVTIIRNGHAVQSGHLDEIRRLMRSTVRATVDQDANGLADLAGVHDFQLDGSHLSFTLDTPETGPVMKVLGDLGVTSLTSSPPSLEELFMREYSTVGDR